MVERTFVAIKPDGVQRALVGEIIQRFEKAGMKIVGLKLIHADKEFAKKHYFDVEERHGTKIFESLVDYLTSGPVIGMAIEGVNAVERVRKIVGTTEPASSPVGTIRGDYAHVTYKYADDKGISVMNLIHASGKKEEADYEIKHWFSDEELFNYETVHDKFVR